MFSLSSRLDVSPDMARRARRLLRHPGLALPACARDVAELLVSELISNCLRYGGLREGDYVDVTITLDAQGLQVEVRNPFDHGVPVRCNPDVSATNGRGLLLLDALASSWQARAEDGLTVQFRLDVGGSHLA